ncbi:MAG: hypothetical protein U5O15_06215 [Candidatus Krumholzibacteriota bacterium]|nr:hypothetical protein [Candidatus Krumholzibacteriota bacterium]
MKIRNIITIFIFLLVALNLSCDEEEKIVEVPTDCPPSPPRGIDADNRDGYVIIWWAPNPESDIAGYDIYRGDSLYGEYIRIGSIDDENPDPYEYNYEYEEPINGEQFYYGVIAFDEGNNESEFSYIVTATPRYEGFIRLYEAGVNPDASGFDFSSNSNSAQRYDSVTTNVWVAEDAEGIQKFMVDNVNDSIQDYGYVDNFDLINYAPTEGWSPSGRAEIIESHLYVIRTGEEAHYVKLYVERTAFEWVEFWWAYQSDPGNTDFSPAPVPGLIERRSDEGRLIITPSSGDR